MICTVRNFIHGQKREEFNLMCSAHTHALAAGTLKRAHVEFINARFGIFISGPQKKSNGFLNPICAVHAALQMHLYRRHNNFNIGKFYYAQTCFRSGKCNYASV